MKITDKVVLQLGITDAQEILSIDGYVSEFVNKIKSVCNRIDFPENLEHLAIKYAKNCAVFYKDGYGKEKTRVKSVSDNGQKVDYEGTETIKEEDVDLEKYVAKNADEISMYAYMRW